MTEYVTKEQVKEKIMEIEKPCYDRLDYYIDSSNLEDEIDNINPADVVERAEYDFIVKNRDYYKDKYEHFLKLCDTYRHKNITLKNKIGKAIEEIKALSPIPIAEDVIDGNPVKDAVWENLIDVLEILKRNIGE